MTDVALGCWPTPLHPVPGHPHLLLKREDLNGLGFGGNKVRALEAIADVVRREASEVLVTGGRADSNRAALAAIAARRLGISCHLVLDPSAGHEPTVVAIARAAGAIIERAPCSGAGAVNARVDDVAEGLRAAGRRCLAVPRAGASPVAVLGYRALADELIEQGGTRPGTEVWLPSGSGTTAAGVCLGLSCAGVHEVKVVAVSVQKPADVMRARIEQQVVEAAGVARRPELAAAAMRCLEVAERPAPGSGALGELAATGVLPDPVFGLPTWQALAERLGRADDGVPRVLVASGGLPGALEALDRTPEMREDGA
ncbi:D-cysteine desulfhydrase [Actinomycetospora sp. NBRC 106375]|nr:D-cysteine desulfhydrase [Actinomycetospora sp. NBRC 106375]